MEDPSFTHLESERLVVRRFRAADADLLAAYRSDPEVARYQGWEVPYATREADAFISSLQHLAPSTPGRWFQFAVGLAPDGTLIGDVALRAGKSDPRQAELGFTFSRSNQSQGYATEAVLCVVAYAFGVLGLHRVFSLTDVQNIRAQRLLERVKFRREGEFRESIWFKGSWATELLYAQLRSEHADRLRV